MGPLPGCDLREKLVRDVVQGHFAFDVHEGPTAEGLDSELDSMCQCQARDVQLKVDLPSLPERKYSSVNREGAWWFQPLWGCEPGESWHVAI